WDGPAPVSTEAPQPERREQRPAKPNERTNVRSDRKGQREEQLLLEKAKGGFNKQKRGRYETAAPVPEPAPREQKPIVIGESITVKELAEKMKKQASELIKKLLGLGVLATINQEIDSDTAEILANELGFKIDVQIEKTDEELLEEYVDDPADLTKRPCVVTVMGHVDHGKTSLLDAIRSTNVIATEAGGITQHIGAYQVEHNGQKITFLDTPGHEAFTAMRARGASVTDVAILVVAADDGVMPQTIEAIAHAKAANVPIIVAINKIDKPGANPDRVKQELTEHGLVSEEWGGDTICVNVSAKARTHIDELLEMILLVTEIQDLKANKKRPGKGTVVEAELDKGRGPVATVLVQNGTLQVGDAIVAGSAFGKVRAMVDDKGRRIKKAGPSTPVEVLGLSDVPEAGDLFYVIEDEKKARQIAERRSAKRKEEELKTHSKITLEDLFKHIKDGEIKELNIIVKADVQGSVEAVKQSLAKLSTDEVRVNTIHGGVGAITESDVMLASASNAIIIGFNVRPDNNARKASEAESVDVRLYRVIYNALEDVKAAMSGLLDPDIKEVIQGRVEIRTIFRASKIGTIAGCYVTEGKVTRDSKVRVIRDGIVIHEGQLDSLKRFKDDAKEVLQGFECGITIEKFNDIQEGDVIEAFTLEEVKREL
ncbi:MAG TPA: translation initiation factor IF-2, partial [Bacillota bacterium]|nr:translation initiation factor IF-2 [Bacillota bacterium]